jgi:conjugal transfer mating pair stabilization protein TraG
MDSVVIYTFGHLSIFKSVFQALAVLFDPTQSEFFVSNDGLGLGVGATLAAMIAFLGAGFSWFDTEKFTPHTALYGMVLYSLLFVPKMDDVWLSDLYSGRTEVVNDVPFGVAIIGSAYSSISVGLARSFEAEYTSPGAVEGLTYGNSILASGGNAGSGFLSPLKAMLYFRHNTFLHLPDHIKKNLISYQDLCIAVSAVGLLPPNPAFSYNDMSKEADPFDYLLDVGFIGTTENATKYNADGTNIPVTCLELNAFLAGTSVDSLEYQLTNADSMGMYAYRATSTGQNFEQYVSQIQNGSPHDTSGAITELSNQLSTILENGTNSAAFMRAALSRDIIRLGNEFHGKTNEELVDYANTMTTAIESSKILQAVEGEEFLKWSMAAMTALQFIFYALTPIVGLALIAKGAASFKYFGSYLLFGLWTYSWIPVASAINFWSIGGFMEAFDAQGGALSITPEMVEVLIAQGEEAIAVGANLLAMTPLITFAILSTGGAYAMTSLAKAANPSGGSKQAAANLTPALRDNPSLVSMSSQATQTVGGQNSSTSAQTRQELKNHSFNKGQDLSDQKATSQRVVDTAESAQTAAKTVAANNMKSVLESVGSKSSWTQTQNAGVDLNSGLTNALRAVDMSGAEISTASRENILATARTGGDIGGAISAAVATSTSEEAGRKLTTSEQQAAETAFLESTSVSEGLQTADGNQVDGGIINAVNESATQLAQTGASLKQAKTNQETDLAQIAKIESYGSAYQKDGDQVHQNAVNQRNSGVTGSFQSGVDYLGQQYHQAAKEHGYSDEEARDKTDKFKAGLHAQFASSEKFGPLDSSSASAFATFFDGVKNPGKDPKENALMQDAQRNLLENTGNSQLNPNKERFSPADKVQANIDKDGAGIKRTVEKGLEGAPKVTPDGKIDGSTASESIAATQRNLSEGAKFEQSELAPLNDAFENFNTASNGVTGLSGDKGANYQANFDAHADRIAGEKYNGKSFADLGRNAARTVAAEAAVATAADFKEDFTKNLRKDPTKNSQYTDSVLNGVDNVLKNPGKIMDFATGLSHENKNEGNLAKGQFAAFGATLNAASGKVGDIKERADGAEQQAAESKREQADASVNADQGRSPMTKFMAGENGVPLGVVTGESAQFEEYYQSLAIGDENPASVHNRVDDKIDDLITEGYKERNMNAQNFADGHNPTVIESNMDLSQNNTGQMVKGNIDAYQAEGFTAPQSLAMSGMDLGANSSGNYEGVAMVSGVTGVVGSAISSIGNKKAADYNRANPTGPTSDNKHGATSKFIQAAATGTFVAAAFNKQQGVKEERDKQVMAGSVNIATNDIAHTAQRLYDGGNQETAISMLQGMELDMGVSKGTLYSENNGQLTVNQAPMKQYINNGGYDGQDKEMKPSERAAKWFDQSNDAQRQATGINQQNKNDQLDDWYKENKPK